LTSGLWRPSMRRSRCCALSAVSEGFLIEIVSD
jgi:hypothetical protein